MALTISTAEAQARTWNRLYVFGDSYSDNGAGMVYSNGPPAVEHAAQRLGLTLIAANAQRARDQSLDFAVSGARSDGSAGIVVQGKRFDVGAAKQVDDFISRWTRGESAFDPDTTLFFVAIGLNDTFTIAQSTAAMRGIIRKLHGAGARHIRIALLPTAIPGMSEPGRRLNPSFTALADDLRRKLKTDITVSNWGAFYDAVIEAPRTYGISDLRNHCAGVALFGEGIEPCKNPDQRYFYYSGHPSAVVNRAVGAMLADEWSQR
jgi:phospholipase/lecithinase/hemolysin